MTTSPKVTDYPFTRSIKILIYYLRWWLHTGAYGGSVSSTAELYKNKEADLGNPNLHNFNIYHTIDEEKVSKSMEHLYDEIKHKNKDYGQLPPPHHHPLPY